MPEPLISIEFEFHPNLSMKRFIYLLVVFVFVGLGSFFWSRPSAETQFSDSGVVSSRGPASSALQSQPVTRVLGGVSEDGELTVGNPAKQAVSSASAQSVKSTHPAKVADVATAKDDDFVRKVISETWLDPEGKRVAGGFAWWKRISNTHGSDSKRKCGPTPTLANKPSTALSHRWLTI